MRYGLGFWLDDATGAVSLHGFDAGVGFVSVHDRGHRFTHTVLCNQTRGAWPTSQRLGQLLAPWTSSVARHGQGSCMSSPMTPSIRTTVSVSTAPSSTSTDDDRPAAM